jgi:hypothetical protein
MKIAIFTICSRNYLAYALTLQKSLQAHEPGRPFFIYLADAPLDPGTNLDAQIIPVRDLNLPCLMDMAFRYTIMEFNTAIKADCFLDLLTRKGFDAAIYLDPDTQVFAPLAEVPGALEGGASAVLTPHLLKPLPEGTFPGELDIMNSGSFNLGFGAFTTAPESLAFIQWWAGHLHTQCYSAPERGLFVDQRFVDLAPAFIDKLSVLRHPGYNVAYWNTANRQVSDVDGQFLVDGLPLVFFHFSGVKPDNPEIYSSHLGTVNVAAAPAVTRLVRGYLAELKAQGHERWSKVEYVFERFLDGTPILRPMRRNPPAMGSAKDWFAAPDLQLWNSADPRIDQERDVIITRLMSAIWETRPDLQLTFPLGGRSGRLRFQNWFSSHGVREYGIPEHMLANGASRGSLRPLRTSLRDFILRLRLQLKKRGLH